VLAGFAVRPYFCEQNAAVSGEVKGYMHINQPLQYSTAASGHIALSVEIQEAREEPENEANFSQADVLL